MAEAMGVNTFRYKVDGLRARRAAGERLGLAVRALPAHRQPVALRPQHGHRVPVHGGARRRRLRLGRARRRRRREDARRPAAGAAAEADRHQRQLRGHRLRHRAGAGAASTRATASGPSSTRACRACSARSTGPTRRALPARAEARRTARCVLDVQAVRKEFGGLVAVNDVSFQVRAGEIVGLIGPNGAGKSTTFNLVTGVLPLTRGGCASAASASTALPSRAIARRGVSRTFQHVKMIPDMTVLENVALGAHLRGRAGVLARDAAPRPRRGAPRCCRGRAPARAHRHGRADARAGRQPRARASSG